MTFKLISADDPVVREIRMQLELGMVGLEEAIWDSVAFGKGANFLKGNDIKVNSLIRQHIWGRDLPRTFQVAICKTWGCEGGNRWCCPSGACILWLAKPASHSLWMSASACFRAGMGT